MTAREPRGFGFIQYFDTEDASDAKYHMDGKMLLGREIVVVFAEENWKKPFDMRAREKISGRGRSYDGRLHSRSPGLNDSPRGRSRSQSRSYSPALKQKHYSRYEFLPSSYMLMKTPCARSVPIQLVGSHTILTGPRLLDLGRDLCRVPQLSTDQGVQAPLLAGLLVDRGLSLLASEVSQGSV
ncbi:Serine/arginine-rich SC35-like splicing factor SCL30A [Zea mays]|uniref:Serine/arginine-rich SC35-like splicing factor SCL30A n=2 Tax=Zea mays TaxID=4577 RepID=A0A3L6EL89_MAIZE|nr:Serine/arginine-rich SC35-like splicing factor SCL30A [Zea mays]